MDGSWNWTFKQFKKYEGVTFEADAWHLIICSSQKWYPLKANKTDKPCTTLRDAGD